VQAKNKCNAAPGVVDDIAYPFGERSRKLAARPAGAFDQENRSVEDFQKEFGGSGEMIAE
jgi:hypothetical protein